MERLEFFLEMNFVIVLPKIIHHYVFIGKRDIGINPNLYGLLKTILIMGYNIIKSDSEYN